MGRDAAATEAAEAAKFLRRMIAECRKEDMTWTEIATICELPAYVVRVLAGDIAGNRMLPEYARSAPRR
jgi:hypothetical protein